MRGLHTYCLEQLLKPPLPSSSLPFVPFSWCDAANLFVICLAVMLRNQHVVKVRSRWKLHGNMTCYLNLVLFSDILYSVYKMYQHPVVTHIAHDRRLLPHAKC